MKKLAAALSFYLLPVIPAYAASPVVLELFTSQGCSSCPPADALLQELSKNPHLLPLSFHVDYWDGAAWRDPFSRPASTERQKVYANALGQGNVYTPELVIDGVRGVIGSRRDEVMAGITAAEAHPKPIEVTLAPGANNTLSITMSGAKPASVKELDIWLVSFNPTAVTSIRGGENSGRELTSVNNIDSVTLLAHGPTLPANIIQATMNSEADNYAVLVQASGGGEILGAGVYQSRR